MGDRAKMTMTPRFQTCQCLDDAARTGRWGGGGVEVGFDPRGWVPSLNLLLNPHVFHNYYVFTFIN